jgi:hypothetical protein
LTEISFLLLLRARDALPAIRPDNNNHLMQLGSSNVVASAATDLTKKSKGPNPDGGTSILAYATTPNDEVHVFYESGNHINEIFQSTPTT